MELGDYDYRGITVRVVPITAAVQLSNAYSTMIAIPQVGAEWRPDAVALGVEVAADLHRVARLTLVRVVVSRRLDEERVLALAHPFDALLDRLHEHARIGRRHERPHSLVDRYR